MDSSKTSSIEPWLTIFNNGEQAVKFYMSAFNAVETYRLQDPNGGLVVRLSVNGAGFWISSETNENINANESLGGNNIRMVLIVNDPDTFYKQAIRAGASEVFPVSEEHGWRLGRLSDPYGLHWEIGHQFTQ